MRPSKFFTLLPALVFIAGSAAASITTTVSYDFIPRNDAGPFWDVSGNLSFAGLPTGRTIVNSDLTSFEVSGVDVPDVQFSINQVLDGFSAVFNAAGQLSTLVFMTPQLPMFPGDQFTVNFPSGLGGGIADYVDDAAAFDIHFDGHLENINVTAVPEPATVVVIAAFGLIAGSIFLSCRRLATV